MQYGTAVTKKYRLKVKWDKSNNSSEYMNKKVVCTVTLEAEQVV